MSTRIVAISAKNLIKIEAAAAGKKKITFPKGANYDNAQIKTEGGAGTAINGNQIRTGAGGSTPINITAVQGIVFELEEKLAEKLMRYIG